MPLNLRARATLGLAAVVLSFGVACSGVAPAAPPTAPAPTTTASASNNPYVPRPGEQPIPVKAALCAVFLGQSVTEVRPPASCAE